VARSIGIKRDPHAHEERAQKAQVAPVKNKSRLTAGRRGSALGKQPRAIRPADQNKPAGRQSTLTGRRGKSAAGGRNIHKWAEMVVPLIRLRKINGWTQAKLARRAGMKQSEIARFESGTTAPRIDMIVRVAIALVDLALMPLNHAGHNKTSTIA
jgi:ribosome-binding protein aMBF1 (putative translation factor)